MPNSAGGNVLALPLADLLLDFVILNGVAAPMPKGGEPRLDFVLAV